MVSMLMSQMFLHNTKNALSSYAFKKLATITKFCRLVQNQQLLLLIEHHLETNLVLLLHGAVRDFSLTTSMTPAEKYSKKTSLLNKILKHTFQKGLSCSMFNLIKIKFLKFKNCRKLMFLKCMLKKRFLYKMNIIKNVLKFVCI